MSELLPCPFCGGEAELHDGVVIIPVIDESGAYIDADVEDTPAWVECAACGAATDGVDSADEAIAAWNRRTQPDNEPITLEELRGMDGQPIYIKHLFGKWHWDGWHILENCEEELIMHDGSILLDENYGKTWVAYRRKPEPEGGERDD